METGGRITRSRAKALGATPLATSELPKTTGRGRRGKAQASEQPEEKPAEQKQLDFEPEADTVAAPPASQPESSQATANSSDPVAECAVDHTLPKEIATPTKASSQPDEVLMASPIVLRSEQPSEASDAAATPQQNEAGEGSEKTDDAPRQFPLFAVAQQADQLTPSPLQPNAASPQPLPASPIDIGFNQEDAAASPAPAAMEASPLPGAASPMDAAAPSPAPMEASPQPVATPLSFTSDLPHGGFEQPAPSPLAASNPATPLATPGVDEAEAMAAAIEAADFSPLPGDDVGSPISLSGEAALTPAPHLQEEGAGDGAMVDDAPMADATPLTFVSDRRATPMAEQSPTAGFFGAASVPHSAAAATVNTSRPSTAASFQGFAAVVPTPSAGNDVVVDSPSLQGLTPAPAASSQCIPSFSPAVQHDGHEAQDTHATTADVAPSGLESYAATVTAATPMDGALPPAPASTPEVGPVPTWTLTQTPINRSIADAVQAQMVDMAMECVGANSVEAADSMEQDSMQLDSVTPEAAQTPITAQPPVKPAAPARSPLPGSALRSKTPVAKPTASKTPGAVGTAKASPYVYVESRYNKTPTTAAAPKSAAGQPLTASKTTPVAPTNNAAGAKSVKRVSIHTPEGPRSIAPQRQVVPTPYRPKSMVEPAVEPAPAAAAAEAPQPAASKEMQPAVPASTPGYLQPTQAFAVKAAKAVKSKVDAGSYDPRSLRQLKREIKEVAAKKAAVKEVDVSEVRATKLTPNVKETQLPMPDDNENSDDEAAYSPGQENELVEAMGGLEVAPPKGKVPLPLRGLPAPQGRHLRFNEKGAAEESPQRVVLRGLPVATGKYKRFA